MPISQNTYTVPNNFVQQYDLGQKKIRADLVDENFSDAAGAINTLLTDDENTVHLTGAETIIGNKTFSGNNTFTGDNTFTGNNTFSDGSLPTATTTVKGIARLATQAEVQAGAASASPLPAVVSINDLTFAGPILMCNTRAILTTSGSWTAPVTGWYKFLIIGGGGGGGGGNNSSSQHIGGGGGASGERLELYKYVIANTALTYTIGAAGSGGASNTDGSSGGNTTITINGTTHTALGGTKGQRSNNGAGSAVGTGLSAGFPGNSGAAGYSVSGLGGSGGGPGGGASTQSTASDANAVGYGGGGAGGAAISGGSSLGGGNGYQGCIVIDYFDPSTPTT